MREYSPCKTKAGRDEFESWPMLIGPVEVSKLGGMHPATVQKLAREGKLPAKKIGDKWLFNKTKIAALFGIDE